MGQPEEFHIDTEEIESNGSKSDTLVLGISISLSHVYLSNAESGDSAMATRDTSSKAIRSNIK